MGRHGWAQRHPASAGERQRPHPSPHRTRTHPLTATTHPLPTPRTYARTPNAPTPHPYNSRYEGHTPPTPSTDSAARAALTIARVTASAPASNTSFNANGSPSSSARAPVASANTVSPSFSRCTGRTARAIPSWETPANFWA